MDTNANDLTTTLYQEVTANGPHDIRLLHLLPGSLKDPLKCTLASANLSTNPPYEALSYVWGPPVFDETIICNELIPFKITSSLHRALVRFRLVDKARTLWVDQLCINQSSKDDRTAQVAKMTRVYSECENAVVWLGDVPGKLQTTLIEIIQLLSRAQKLQFKDGLIASSSDVSSLPLSQMSASQRKRYGLPSWTDPRWKILLYVYASLWMRRTWIVQEVALPRKVDVLIGPVLVDWNGLSSLLFYVESLKVSGLNFGTLGSWRAFLALGARRVRTQKRDLSPLSDLLFEHRRGKATEARDRIFGLMGLAKERETLPPADYRTDVVEMFTEATVGMFQRDGKLDILGLVGPTRGDRPEGLPSWVPGYGNTGGPHPVTKRGTLYTSKTPQVAAKFAASGQRPLSFGFGRDGHTLILPGMIIGEIQDLADYYTTQRDDEVDLQRGLFMVNLAYAFHSLQNEIEAVNTSLSWDKLIRRISKTYPRTYKPTSESLRDALLLASYEGQLPDVTDELLAVQALEHFALTAWKLLTFNQGCAYLPLAIPLITILGLLIWLSKPFWAALGYPSVSILEKYAEMAREASERRLCTTSNGLIGLAPPDSLPGDKIALVQGGRVPLVLRWDGEGFFRLVGEAYVHGAMFGDMFDAEQVAMMKIK